MNDHAAQLPMMNTPTREEAASAVREAQRIFARMLAAWAVDSLRVRRAHLDRLSWIDSPRGLGKAA